MNRASRLADLIIRLLEHNEHNIAYTSEELALAILIVQQRLSKYNDKE